MTEAGLLDNETIIHFNLYKLNDSSQMDRGANVSSFVSDGEEVTALPTVDTAMPEVVMFDVSNATEVSNNGTSSSGEYVARAETSDVEDTYNCGNIDMCQYPIKRLADLKSGEKEAKSGEGTAEPEGTVRHVESVKIVEEKLNISIAVESSSVSSVVESTTEDNLTTESSVEPTVTTPFESSTLDVMNGTDSDNETLAADEADGTTLGKDELARLEVVTLPGNVTEAANETTVVKDVVEDTLRNESLVIENKVEERIVHTTVEPFAVKNRVAAATSAHNFESGQPTMNAGSVTGITLGILVTFALFGAISFVLYRRRYLNKPQVLHEKCSNLDSSGYIDDASLKENSEEMYSLDNDSFLNSLEAMTIQNYWTENVKHTKL
ncbi:hypothetical protein RUM44_002470 [Polyplax serrata]|uniref:Uncharacterized protein n=1 Tax=Polyplax serrata TaxID=468196 RepID=A0ABR1AEZ5_POLSC